MLELGRKGQTRGGCCARKVARGILGRTCFVAATSVNEIAASAPCFGLK